MANVKMDKEHIKKELRKLDLARMGITKFGQEQMERFDEWAKMFVELKG